MRRILLDREGKAAVPGGFVLVATEVAFLDEALGDHPLLVRGARLCGWAEAFYRGREIRCEQVVSPIRALLSDLPMLNEAQAQDLYERLKDRFAELEQPYTIRGILNALYPDPLWSGLPSGQHAAEWLLWLYQRAPEGILEQLLRSLGEDWAALAQGPECIAYQAWGRPQALELLNHWIGVESQPELPSLGEFPLEVPLVLQEQSVARWRKEVVDSEGALFDDIYASNLPDVLKRKAAQETVAYFHHHPGRLTLRRLEHLSPYLTKNGFAALQVLLSPLEPGALPSSPDKVLQWYREEYLPYRLWQRKTNDLAAQEQVLSLARQFALWYVSEYLKMAIQPFFLYEKAAALTHRIADEVVLMVVLDGCSMADTQTLLSELGTIPRLSLLAYEMGFATIPTVTQFAKDALIRGVPPMYDEKDIGPLGMILPENELPSSALGVAEAGSVYIWRMLEPDRTYHGKNSYDTLEEEVETQLRGVVKKIGRIVEEVPDHLRLHVIITTDHGRMLGNAKRTIPVPAGFQAHGRAAWGKGENALAPSGFSEVDNALWIDGKSLRFPYSLVVPLDECTFLTSDGKGGAEDFPHGGLFPEEVIAPWLVCGRDIDKPKIQVTISGTGQASRQGQLNVQITNVGDLALQVTEIVLTYGIEKASLVMTPHRLVRPRDKATFSVEFAPWPSKSQAAQAKGNMRLKKPDGGHFEANADVQLQTQEMYTRDESLLADLG